MRKTYLFFLFLLTGLFSGAQAQDAAQLLDSANQQYNRGQYRKAIETYEQVLARGQEAPGVYYNLGNAYYKTNQLGPAILNYERARLREPGNEDIHYNLDLARQQITDRIEQIPDFFLTRWVRQFINLLPSDQWAVMSAATFVIFLVFLTLYLYTRRLTLKKSSFWMGILALVIAVASFVFAMQQKKDIVDSQQAIVFDSKVVVRSSPARSGTELFVIHEGTKVYLEDKVSGWYEIRLSDGSQGWLKQETVEPV
jgi:tetratricopeptide (TPR) repeat protein